MTAHARIRDFTPLSPDPIISRKSVSALIFTDHPVFRSGLTWKLHDSAEIEISGESGSLAEVIEFAQSARPDVLIAEMRIGDGNAEGVESVTRISKLVPDVPVIVYSEFYSASYRDRMLRSGASAFVMKASDTSQLVEAIHDVVAEPTPHAVSGAA